MTQKTLRRFCKIHTERGYGTDMFEILNERGIGSSAEVSLKGPKGSFWIYKMHTYRDREVSKADLQAKKDYEAAAQLIGRKD